MDGPPLGLSEETNAETVLHLLKMGADRSEPTLRVWLPRDVAAFHGRTFLAEVEVHGYRRPQPRGLEMEIEGDWRVTREACQAGSYGGGAAVVMG